MTLKTERKPARIRVTKAKHPADLVIDGKEYTVHEGASFRVAGKEKGVIHNNTADPIYVVELMYRRILI
jgi:hypothetical protein